MISKIRSLVQKNFMVKAVCLLISIVLWMVVMNEQNPTVERSYTLAIEQQNSPQGFVINQSKNWVRITVQAPRSAMMFAESGDFKARADLAGLTEGTYSLPIAVTVPQGMELTGKSPETVEVTLDPLIEKQLPVDVAVSGSAVESIEKNPAEITLVGSKSVVDKAFRVMGYLRMQDNEETVEKQVPLTVIDEEGREVAYVKAVPSTITVKAIKAKKIVKKTVPVSPVIEDSASDEIKIETVRVIPNEVEISGDEKTVAGIEKLNTLPVSMKDADKTFSVVQEIDLPQKISASTLTVEVEVVIKKVEKP